MLRAVIDARRDTLTDEHPDTLIACGHLGYALLLNGEAQAAALIVGPALQLSLRTHGQAHPASMQLALVAALAEQ